ncbi:MAG: type II toxin-antitoxin system RelE/ParE family toxin [Firmicutes bacterium]|nr:type II toxin-antitoxin system RelE/ParE family toxin [Bacillota bacterium]
MNRSFIILNEFDRQWKNLKLNDDDLRQLQLELLRDPKAGDVIQGTNGIRKLRFALDAGKSGGARVIYVDYTLIETIVLLTAYGKNEKDNLSKSERNNLKKLNNILYERLKKGE